MFNFAERRKLYFLISAAVIIPGLIAMIYSTITDGSPIKLSIDFTGGTLMDVSFVDDQDEQDVRDTLQSFGLGNYIVQRLDPISTDVIAADQQQAGSRFLITVPNTTGTTEFFTFLQDPEQLGAFWSSLSTDDDPDRLDATNITPAEEPGYSVLDLSLVNDVNTEAVTTVLEAFGIEDAGVQVEQIDILPAQAGSRWQLRMEEIEDENRLNELKQHLRTELGAFWSLTPSNPTAEITSSSVSATVGKEVTRAAIVATMAVAVIVLVFIVFAFRKVPQSFRYGACAIIAMFHDILITMGVMSILGLLFEWEADALFLTAILTVVGFSVQDSIVVFDRIRENTPKYRGEPYEVIVNRSVLETVHRSLATQLNAIFVMVAILLFGGETIRQFIGILLIGLMSGTYSSIFNAVPLLVSWEKGEIPFVNREAKRKRKQAEAAS
ncbi:MAG: protein translocase subunit SecF [Anaerolineae bacterium]|nr:protein translocase subunit SecF [Anaerolineae bacterium]